MGSVIKCLKRWAGLVSKYPEQSFTFFVPSPPERNQGYREKEFDKLFFELTQAGFEIIDLTTQRAHHGMWIIIRMRPLKKELTKLDLNFHMNRGLHNASPSSDIILEDDQ